MPSEVVNRAEVKWCGTCDVVMCWAGSGWVHASPPGRGCENFERRQVGDRVQLSPSGFTGSGRPRTGLAVGTVTGTDARGVSVQFDAPHNGIGTCHATYWELAHYPATDSS